MNGTELKTLRQSLWLSLAEAAHINDVRERVYRYWESGDWIVPDDVAERMERLDDTLAGMAGDALRAYRGEPDKVLIRYPDDDSLAQFEPRYSHIPAACHAAGLDRIRQRLRGTCRVRVVTMATEDCTAWLRANGLPQTAENLARWAATVTDPPSRAKKAAQASGEEKPA